MQPTDTEIPKQKLVEKSSLVEHNSNTIPIWSYRYQLRPHAKAFWNTHIQLMKQVVMGFHFSQIFYMCMEYKRQYWKFLLFFLVQQCSRYSILLCFFVPCRDGLYHILLSITKEAQSSSFHKQIEKFLFYTVKQRQNACV